MEKVLHRIRIWGAPGAALVFGLYWTAPYSGLFGSVPTDLWPILPIFLLTAAIATAVRWPVLSVTMVAILLVLQMLKMVSPMTSVMWQVYIGSFLALAFILWTSTFRVQLIAIGLNLVYSGVMAFIIVSREYGAGGGWFRVAGLPKETMVSFWWQCSSVLLVIAAACAIAGVCLRFFEERGGLFRATQEARADLKQAEIDLIVEQERSRISRDLHDVLAHSLAVIAAQADGSRYSHPEQPESALTSLRNISRTARNALVDVQQVIDNAPGPDSTSVQPQLDDIDPLIHQMQQAGMDVQYRQAGSVTDMSTGQQRAVFRILQECLTNALKHGGLDSAATIRLDWQDAGISLTTSSRLLQGTTTSNHDVTERVGRGIPGMRERARLVGGWLTVDQVEQQFVVTAFIPYGNTHGVDGAFSGESPRAIEPGTAQESAHEDPAPAGVRGKVEVDHG